MSCITNVSFVVLINGVASPFFLNQRGQRQGCPISPLFFLLAIEGLSKLLHQARRARDLRGIEVATNLYISHLLFVDDIFLFSNGSRLEIQKLKIILDIFMKENGMAIKNQKSTLTHDGITKAELTWTYNLLPFNQTMLGSSISGTILSQTHTISKTGIG